MSLTLSLSPDEFAFSGNPLVIEIDNNMSHIVDSIPVLNYKIGIRLYRFQDATAVLVKTLLHEVDTNGKARFNLAPYLENETTSLPDLQGLINLRSPGLLKYFFDYFSQGGSEQSGIEQYTSNPYYTLSGGIGQNKQDGFLNNWIQQKKFLSWAPSRFLKSAQEDLLYLILPAGEDLKLRLEGVYADGSSISNALPSVYLYARKLYEINTGKAIASQVQNKSFQYIDVWMEDIYGDPHTEVRRYYGDPRIADDKMLLMYLNSFGVWELLYLYGAFDQSAKTKSESASYENRTEIYKRQWSELYSCSMDFKSPAEVQHLRELLRSTKVYLQSDDKWIPVQFPDSKTLLKRSHRHDTIVQLKFETVDQDEYYSL